MRKKILIFLIVIISSYAIKSVWGIDLLDGFSLRLYKSNNLLMFESIPMIFAAPAENKKQLNVGQINVYYDKVIGRVNNKIFGQNLLGHSTQWQPGNAFSDYGAGIWNKGILSEPLKLAQGIGISCLRFPGGCGAHDYDWKKTIGANRQGFAFGIDEFLHVCETLKAEPVFTISYFTGQEQDAADLVEYLNANTQSGNPGGGTDWAKQRAANGHQASYNVKYFEIGNEIWHGDHKKIKKVTAEQYAQRYLKYYQAIKSVDPAAQVGIALAELDWNQRVLKIVKQKIDFGILHQYPTPAWGKALETIDPDAIFKTALAMVQIIQAKDIEQTLSQLKQYSGRDIPLAITEYNGGFVQDKPVPYRYSLGNALVNAQLIELYTRFNQQILLANHWNFINEYWGMIANGFNGRPNNLNQPYFKRPNYYVFKMYHDYFADILIEAEVKSPEYDIAEYSFFLSKIFNALPLGKIVSDNLLSEQWQINQLPGVRANQDKNILSLEFIDPNEFNYYHCFKTAKVKPKTYYRLSGYIKTRQLADIEDNGVCLEVQDARGWSRTHSAMSTSKLSKTHDWVYLEIIYKTLADATAVNIFARRIGQSGPLKGQAYFKDIKLVEFIPGFKTEISYLSVNASKDSNTGDLYLMVINKHPDSAINTEINIRGFNPQNQAKAWVLSGPNFCSNNETEQKNVGLTEQLFDLNSNKFSFEFKAHSLTAIKIDKR